MSISSATKSPPRRLQFGLRTLLLVVTGCCILFAVMGKVGALGSLQLCFLLLLIFLHVAGNALGTRLRDESTRAVEADPPMPSVLPVAVFGDRAPGRLEERTPLGRFIFVAVGLGAVVGGTLVGLALQYWGGVTTAGVVVGSISAAIIGGFFAFMASSFLKMAISAWRQAQ